MKIRSIYRLMTVVLMLMAWAGVAAQQYVVCNASNVRLRTGPSTNYPMLVWTATNKPVYINKGEKLTYLGDDSKDFYNVQFDGKSVYISKKYAKLMTPAKEVKKDSKSVLVVVNGENVRLRHGASLNAAIYCDKKGKPVYPPKGARLTYVGEKGDWYKVYYAGKTLYISKKHCYLL